MSESEDEVTHVEDDYPDTLNPNEIKQTKMDFLLRLDINSASTITSLASLQVDVKTSKTSLNNLSKDLQFLKATLVLHTKRPTT
ncbi:unnamed protein product [Allacma fusca]|uniref:Uncharacterized protein n=1 Tax=Allacma fusca TaxID=39272 RepID=A0A8J2PJJ6_9HEXA|nr:unnamed protein product [Allacma fusca]